MPHAMTPEIRLAAADGNLQLDVKAKAGVNVTLERRESLASGTWTPVQSFAMANDSETLVLPRPAGAAAFWRVTAP